jgi:hypothetical protein
MPLFSTLFLGWAGEIWREKGLEGGGGTSLFGILLRYAQDDGNCKATEATAKATATAEADPFGMTTRNTKARAAASKVTSCACG